VPLKKIKLKTKIVQNSSDPKRLKFIGYSGDAVDLSDYNFDAPVVYDLDTLKVQSQNMPLNYNHRIKIGQTETVKNTKQLVRGTAALTEPNGIAQKIENSTESYEASMGLDVREAVVTYHKDGFSANGQQFEGPHYLIKNSLLDEMTVTEKGRDSMTKVHKLSRMELSTIKNSAPKKTAKKAPTRVVNTKRRRPEPDPDPTPTPRKKLTNSSSHSVARKNTGRVSNSATIPYTKLRRLENRYPEYQELIYSAVDKGWDYNRILNKVRLSAAEDGLPRPPHTEKTGSVDLIEARLVNSLCKEPEITLKKHYGEEVMEQILNAGHIGMKELMVLGANKLGGNFTGYSDLDQLIDFIGNANTGRIKNTGFSTFSMPNLFKRAAEIVLEESWKIEEFFAPSACYPTSHSDFKTQERYRPSGGAMWEGLDNQGRVKHGSYGKEHRYTATLDTKAQMLGFDRETIENDDMGIVEEIMNNMVEGAMMVPDYKLMQHLYAADGAGFWALTATESLKKNSYTSTALTRANLKTVYLAAQNQTIDKGRVNWINQITDQWDVVIGPALEETAWDILKQDKIISPVDTTTTRGDKNYWFGKFGIKVFNQIGNTSMHANTVSTDWFLWPKSVKYSPFAISYLRGRKRPVIKVREAPVDMLGFVVVGVYDVNINDREPSAVVRAKA
jgi:hypothetical protein